MGKVRGKKDASSGKRSGAKGSGKGSDLMRNSVGKISADISAINLGPPRTKILKKAAPGGSLLLSNFASRGKAGTKEKKKVTFCQNLIAEKLGEHARGGGESAKEYFKVIHPSAIGKKSTSRGVVGAIPVGNTDQILSATSSTLVPDPDVLMTTSVADLRKIIKNSVTNKKTRLKARKVLFKKKMGLLKIKQEESVKTKQRQQTVIVGDMHPMLQALPSLSCDADKVTDNETDCDLTAGASLKRIPEKTKYSVKKNQQAVLDSLKFFEASGVKSGLSAN